MISQKVFYLIDNDPDEEFVFKLALDGMDAKVIWESNAKQALNSLVAGTVNPHYIFVDINMPEMDGWECVTRIRQLQHLTKTPIVMYSTSATESFERHAAYAPLISDCLDKLPSVPELSKFLQGFMERHAQDL